MSEIKDFPRVAPRQRDWKEAHRRDSDAINYLLQKLDELKDANTALEARVTAHEVAYP